MSECFCLSGHADGEPCIIVTRPKFVKYLARVRRIGERRYTIVKQSRSRRVAYRALAEAMMERQWFRGDVLGCEGPDSYYDPSVLVEMKR